MDTVHSLHAMETYEVSPRELIANTGMQGQTVPPYGAYEGGEEGINQHHCTVSHIFVLAEGSPFT